MVSDTIRLSGMVSLKVTCSQTTRANFEIISNILGNLLKQIEKFPMAEGTLLEFVQEIRFFGGNL